MPYAQVHYPFENQEWFESHFPGDFIVEYIGQTRGWFYTLHVLATALFDRPSFKTCVVHGVLLGDDGQKLSKRLAQLSGSGRRVRHRRIRRDAVGAAVVGGRARRRHGGRPPSDGRGRAPRSHADLERVVLPRRSTPTPPGSAARSGRAPSTCSTATCWPRSARLRADVTARLDAFDLSGACASILSFIDSLNNWYIRRSRDRFWAGDKDAVDTLHTVLAVLCRARRTPAAAHDRQACTAISPDASRCTSSNWPSSDELVLDIDPDLVDDHGSGQGRLLGRRVGAQGQRHPQPSAAREAHRGGAGRRERCGRSRRSSPTRRT